MKECLLFSLIGISAFISAIPQTGTLQRRKVAAKTLSALPIGLEPVLTTGLTNVVFVTNARDGTNRLFILEQSGTIKVVQPGSTSATVLLDITARVIAGEERGLLGLAFHPSFTANRRFFVFYTRSPDGTIVIAEYLVSSSNPNLAETTERVILSVTHPLMSHNGGALEFGPDGFLYIGLGDGGIEPGPSNPAQNMDDLRGKILRIDIDNPESPSQPYSSPSSNPFFGSIPGRDEIYALGMRNPWRFSFDRLTGDVYLADVGNEAKEEIDIVTLGGNYGWSVLEGTLCTGSQPELCTSGIFTSPIFEYTHTGHCAIIGGYAYRGSQSTLPPGSYVYGDLCSGEIFLLEQGSVSSMLLDTSVLLSSFGQDESGEIYVVDLLGGIYRIVTALDAASLDIQMSQSSYVTGQTVSATEFGIKNLGTAAAIVELKVWLTLPTLDPVSILNLGADGSFSIPAGFDQDLGPLTLFSVTADTPRGSYQFSSRMVRPKTGKLVVEDLNSFSVE